MIYCTDRFLAGSNLELVLLAKKMGNRDSLWKITWFLVNLSVFDDLYTWKNSKIALMRQDLNHLELENRDLMIGLKTFLLNYYFTEPKLRHSIGAIYKRWSVDFKFFILAFTVFSWLCRKNGFRFSSLRNNGGNLGLAAPFWLILVWEFKE